MIAQHGLESIIKENLTHIHNKSYSNFPLLSDTLSGCDVTTSCLKQGKSPRRTAKLSLSNVRD